MTLGGFQENLAIKQTHGLFEDNQGTLEGLFKGILSFYLPIPTRFGQCIDYINLSK